jgi:hypothetical protein
MKHSGGTNDPDTTLTRHQGGRTVPTSDRRIVLVLGPGRSGTSTMAGTLAMSGFDVPKAIAGKESNPSGFYEPRWVVNFHRGLLQRADVRTLDADPDSLDQMAPVLEDPQVRAELRTWLEKRLAEHPRLVIKDPRLVWFRDLWVDVAGELGQEPGFVFMLRHPSEVSSSRSEYYDAREVTAVGGWINVALMTERLTQGSPRALVHYPQLTADWRTEAGRVRDLLGLTLDPAPDVTPHPVDDFIDPTLRRRQPGWDDAQVPRFLQQIGEATFQALGDLAEHGDSPERAARLDELREHYRTLHSDALDLVRPHTLRDRAAAVKEAKRKTRAEAEKRAAAARGQRAQQGGRAAEDERDRLQARVRQLERSWLPGALRRPLSALRRRIRS